MGQEQGPRNYFKAPEGKYPLHSDRSPFCNFVPQRPLRLTFASIQHQGSSQHFIIYNMADALAFSPYAHTDKVSISAKNKKMQMQNAVMPNILSAFEYAGHDFQIIFHKYSYTAW